MKTERHNVVSLYLSDKELHVLEELAEIDGRSKTQKARILMFKGIDALREEISNEHGK